MTGAGFAESSPLPEKTVFSLSATEWGSGRGSLSPII